jgi:tellurite resistance protein TerC
MDISTIVSGVIIIAQIVAIEGILSIDNAAVLGAMTHALPNEPLNSKGINRFMPGWIASNQRDGALRAGLIGAYVGRGLALVAASLIIAVPLFRYIGAGYLLLLVWNYFVPERFQLDLLGFLHKKGPSKSSVTFWETVIAVELADLAFSIDNVVAVVALTSNIVLVILGVIIGITFMRFAASIFQRLIDVEPSLASAAYLIILSVAAKLFVEEFTDITIPDIAQLGTSLSIIALVVIVARIRRARVTSLSASSPGLEKK